MWQHLQVIQVSCLSLAGFGKASLTSNIPHKEACRILGIWNLYFDEETKLAILGPGEVFTCWTSTTWMLCWHSSLSEPKITKPFLHHGEERGGSHSSKRLLFHARASEILLENLLCSYSCGLVTKEQLIRNVKKQKWSVRFNCETPSLCSRLSVSCHFALSH